MFTGLAQYEAGCSWVISMSTSNVHRRFELQCAVRFDVFVYVSDVLCMRGDFDHLGDMVGRWLAWLAWLALIQRFDW